MRFLLLLFPGLLVCGSSLEAQATEGSPPPGTRVRILAPETTAKRVQGEIVYLDADSVVLKRRTAEILVVPTRAIESLEVSHGRDHLKGLGRGMIWGLVPGGVVGYLGASSYGARDGWTIWVAMIGAGTGSVVGGLAGAALGVRRWEVDPSWPRLDVAPARGGGATVQGSWRVP